MNDKDSCCAIASVSINSLPTREKEYISSFMPDAISAIVVAHHVTTIDEWTWYQSAEGGQTAATQMIKQSKCVLG